MLYVAITISPKHVELDPRTVLNIYQKNYLDRIRVPYLLYPEFDLNGRLHFHGYFIRHEDNIHDYHWTIKMLKNWCFICVKEVKHKEKWFKYCRKDWKITKKILKLKKPLENNTNELKGITILDYKGFRVDKELIERWENGIIDV